MAEKERDDEGLIKALDKVFADFMKQLENQQPEQPDPRSVKLSAYMNKRMDSLKGHFPEVTLNNLMQAVLSAFNQFGFDDIIIENNKFKAIAK